MSAIDYLRRIGAFWEACEGHPFDSIVFGVLQVQQGTCGDPVSYYLVEWDTSVLFNSVALSSVVLDGDDLLLEEQVGYTLRYLPKQKRCMKCLPVGIRVHSYVCLRNGVEC